MCRMVLPQVLCRVIALISGLGLILFCGSCSSYRTFEVEVLTPADVTLGQGKKLGYLNRHIRKVQDTSFILYAYEGMTPDELSGLFYQGLTSAWTEDGTRDSIPAFAENLVSYMRSDSIPPAYPAADIQKICRTFGLDYVVSLETYYYTVNERSGSIKSNYCVRLYAADEPAPVDLIVYRDDLTDYLTDEFNFLDFIRANAWDKGALYCKRLIPHWEVTERRVYNRQKVLRMGDIFYRQNDVEQAMKTLQTFPGIGRWTANYFALRGWQAKDVFLPDDYLIKQRFPGMTPAQIRRYAERWKPWRSYALLHIWYTEGWQPDGTDEL